IFCISAVLLFSCKDNKQGTNSSQKNSHHSPEIISQKSNGINYGKEIIPGKKLGNIYLNESGTAIVDSLGKPVTDYAAMGKCNITWKKHADLLLLYTDTQMGLEDCSKIKAIRPLSKDVQTVDNLGVSTSIDALKRYYRVGPVGKLTYNGKQYYL